MIVEDDLGQSALGAAMLEELDLEVEQVETAEAAIDHLCQSFGRVSLVLADVHLAGPMSGVALAHRISVLWPTISVIITSGDPQATHIPLPAQATYVPKPWRALDIVAAAERAARADHSVRAVQL